MQQKQQVRRETKFNAQLDDIAINQGCGYKAANLTVLKDISAKINTTKPAYTIAVPEFIAIPSQTIQKFVFDNTQHDGTEGFDIANQWKNVIDRLFPNPESQNNTLSNKQYPDGFLDTCTALEQDIQKKINAIDPDKLSELKQLLQLTASQQERLMVRSSGKEDTKTLANAGGNASVANVTPDNQSILHAISTVVSSYFSKKSLIQRLGAKDASLFELSPLTPVIIQRMISTKDNNITKCGVMFTEEAEGGIAKNSTSVAQTTGITLIQAAYGHNEGVVNSLIPVDTYYSTADKSIFTVIRPKTYRMAPKEEESGALTLEKNDTAIIKKPALSTDAVDTLKYLATELERTYQGPMDVEFVINEDEKTLYIVQARPLVYDRNTPKASYIINPDTITAQKLTGSAIGVAGGALRHCTSADQLIAAGTIKQALSQYQDLSGAQKEQIQCIIIGTMAPTTSHEATAFRSESKPVLYCHNLQTVEEWLKQSNTNILISPQQGLIINFGDQPTSVQQLITDQSAALGWTNYPIEPYLSLIPEFNENASLTLENIRALLPESIDKEQFKKEALTQRIPWKQLLGAIKIKQENGARVALAALLYEIQEIIQNTSENMKLDEDLTNKIQFLQSYLMYCAQNITKTLQFEPTHARYPQRLFAIRFLESLLYQQPLLNEIINGYSVTTVVAKEVVPEQQIIKEATETGISLDDMSVQLMKIKKFAMTPELENEWTTFVQQLNKLDNPELQKLFPFLIRELSTLDILPIWLNTAFATKITKNPDAEILIKALVAELITQKDFLAHIAEKKELLTSFNKQAFAEPKTFESQWNLFKKDFLTYFLDDTFIETFKSANALGQLAALNILGQFIDTFDLSIKEVTGSTSYTNDEEKVKNFHTMLVKYAELLNQLIKLIPDKGLSSIGNSKLIKNIVGKPSTDQNNLKATPNFDAAPFTLSSKIAHQMRSWFVQPTTYEDIFTVVHQSLIDIIAELNQSNDYITNINMPSLLTKLNDKILTLKARENTASRIGIYFSPESIELKYNLPVYLHSLQIKALYNKSSKSIDLYLHFYGENASLRWDCISLLTRMVASKYSAQIKNGIVNNTSCIIGLSVNNTTNLDQLIDFIERIVLYTINPKTYPITQYSNLVSTETNNLLKQEKDPYKRFIIYLISRNEDNSSFQKKQRAAILLEGLKSTNYLIQIVALDITMSNWEQAKEINDDLIHAINILINSDNPDITNDMKTKFNRLNSQRIQQTTTTTKPQTPTVTPNFTQRIFTTVTSTLQNSTNWLKGFWGRFFG